MKRGLFSSIAPLYGCFFQFQLRMYRKFLLLPSLERVVGSRAKVLDVGFGTGALMQALLEQGHDVAGVDYSTGMLRVARKKLKTGGALLFHEDVREGLSFETDSFDVVFAAYVVHGLSSYARRVALEEMARVARKAVILFEHSDSPGLMVNAVEWLEGNHFATFKKERAALLASIFDWCETIPFSKRSVVYVCQQDIL